MDTQNTSVPAVTPDTPGSHIQFGLYNACQGSAQRIGTINLNDLTWRVQNDVEWQALTQTYRGILERDGKDAGKDFKAKSLPAITASGVINGRRRESFPDPHNGI